MKTIIAALLILFASTVSAQSNMLDQYNREFDARYYNQPIRVPSQERERENPYSMENQCRSLERQMEYNQNRNTYNLIYGNGRLRDEGY